MPNLLPIAKTAINLTTGVCVTRVIKTVIVNNVSEPETTAEAVQLAVGSVVLASMVSDAASTYTDQAVDKIAGFFAKKQSSPEPTE